MDAMMLSAGLLVVPLVALLPLVAVTFPITFSILLSLLFNHPGHP